MKRLLKQTAIAEHEQLVVVDDCGKPMGDGQQRHLQREVDGHAMVGCDRNAMVRRWSSDGYVVVMRWPYGGHGMFGSVA